MLGKALSLQESIIRRRVDRRGVALEAIVVLFCGLLGSVGLAYFALEMWNAVETRPAYLNFTLIGHVVSPVILVVLVWLLYTVSAHLLAGFFGGRGPIVRLVRVAAWSIVPIGIWLLVRSIVIVALFFDFDFPEQPDGLTPQVMVENVLGLGLETPAYFATFLVGVLFLAWSWHLLAVGIESAKDLSRDDARKLAAIPAAIVALYLVRAGLQWWTPV